MDTVYSIDTKPRPSAPFGSAGKNSSGKPLIVAIVIIAIIVILGVTYVSLSKKETTVTVDEAGRLRAEVVAILKSASSEPAPKEDIDRIAEKLRQLDTIDSSAERNAVVEQLKKSQ